ncbi:hypothetical protein HID58_014561, partial [Brassica napus]
ALCLARRHVVICYWASKRVEYIESLLRSIKAPVETPMPPDALVVKSDTAWSIQHEAGGMG